MIENLDPKCVWGHFYTLTQIPRPSKKEGKAVQYLLDFGKKLGLETIQDAIGNVMIRKPATPGMEDRKGVVLQAHIDMVPQKNNDKVHDWENDPIEPRIVEDWVYATDTTLGADNGLGCAVAMAVLEATDLVHGPIEALFTIDEETGMTGARELQPGVLKGDILINLDSEDEGELYVGCAGGLDLTAEFDYTEEDMPAGYKCFDLSVKGLRGGHSGMEINEGRGNSNKMITRIMLPMLRDLEGRLVHIEGGNLRNAIPREAAAIIAIPTAKVEEAKEVVVKTTASLLNEYSAIEPNLEVNFTETQDSQKVIEGCAALRIVKSVVACPNGVERMSLAMENLVETSSNLAIVVTKEGKASINILMRGSIDSAKEDLSEILRASFELAGAKVSLSGGYSGWQPNMDSEILKTMKETYKSMTGEYPLVKGIHAGLECGILAGAYPNWDMISCGPTIRSPHSPDERVLIPSVAKWWDFVVESLKNVPKK